MNFRSFAPAAAVLSLAVAACGRYDVAEPATPFNAFAPLPEDRAQICVLRDSAMAQLVIFPVRDGDTLVGATRGHGYFCYQAAPGKHVLSISSDETERVEIVAEAGRRYYLMQNVENILGYVRTRSTWIEEDAAREHFADLPHQVLIDAPEGVKLPGETPFAPATSVQTAAANAPPSP